MMFIFRHCGVKFSSDKEREELAGLEPENQLATFTGIYICQSQIVTTFLLVHMGDMFSELAYLAELSDPRGSTSVAKKNL